MIISIFYDNNILNKNKLKESWVKKNFPNDYINIISMDIRYNRFSQLLYHYIHNIVVNIKCEYCDNINMNFLGFDLGYTRGCSRSCNIQLSRPDANKKRKENTINKFGIEHTSQLSSTKEKMKKTNLDKYGSTAPAGNEKIMNKIKNTNKEKYGVDLPMQSNDIKRKYKETSIIKYGVDNFAKTDEWKEKVKMNGVYHIEKDEIKEKIKETVYNKNLKVFSDKYSIGGYKLLGYETNFLIYNCDKCKVNFKISINLAHQRIFKHKIDLCTIHNPLNNRQSNKEREISDWIKSLGVNVEESNRKILHNKKEIDIWLPYYKIGIEYNGLYWHSEIYKDKNYHYDKYLISNDNKFQLIQIWEDVWENKEDIVKSIIKNRLGLNEKIWARKCTIKIVNSKETKTFLNNNHIQGWSVSKYNIGLYYNGELVSLMTFGSNRKNLGSTPKEDEYELIRYCNKVNLSIIGGANKLFKYFIDNYKPNKITSYSENDLFLGDLYHTLGMKFVSETGPNFYWSDGTSRMNRWNFRKDKLNIDIPVDQYMIENGYFKVWNSGNKKWIWCN